MHQKPLGGPDPLGELKRSPHPLAAVNGLGPQEGKGERGGEGKVGRGEGREGREGEGKGEGMGREGKVGERGGNGNGSII